MTRESLPVLRRLLLAQQDELRCSLGAHRTSIDHAGLKGGASEDQWRAALSTYLPQRYRVGTGVVVDSEGAQSQQIDIIIHDAQYCPLFRYVGNLSFVPAESVYAVLEVKQEIDAQYLCDAADKAESVRQLARTSGPIVDRGQDRPPRDPHDILAGVVGLTSGWVDGLGGAFQRELGKYTRLRRLDFGCVLDVGGFEVPDGASPPDVIFQPAGFALVSFFMVLVRRLQRLGTVPAIDWSRYEAALIDPPT